MCGAWVYTHHVYCKVDRSSMLAFTLVSLMTLSYSMQLQIESPLADRLTTMMLNGLNNPLPN